MGGCAREKRAGTDDLDARSGASRVEAARVAKSFRLSVIDWLHVSREYVPYVLSAAAVFAVAALLPERELSDVPVLLAAARTAGVSAAERWYAWLILATCAYWALSFKPSVYLIDFAVFRPPPSWRVSSGEIMQLLAMQGVFTPESLDFQARVLERSGTGETTHWPPAIVQQLRPELAPRKDADGNPLVPSRVDASIPTARACAETVMFSVVEELMQRTGLRAKDIDFLIVNCSLFCPTPSLCASVARKFGLRPDVRTYNLGGMGCSAGVISIDLAKQLLENSSNSTAVVISLEEISQNLYLGNVRSMLVQNTLFRSGGAAILLSNKPMDSFRAKYKLLHTVRVQNTAPEAVGCILQTEDGNGVRGVELSKDIPSVASRTLRDNLTMLGPHILPVREQAKVALNIGLRRATKALNGLADRCGLAHIPGTKAGRFVAPSVYVPDFKTAVAHFCIHAGGRAVIDGIEESLRLTKEHTAPSRAALKNFGNTSSSSIWYELKYVEGVEEGFIVPPEEHGGHQIAKGDRVLQIAFGSGFKCNSAVWLRMAA